MPRSLNPCINCSTRAVADQAFPGGVLAVGHRGELFVHAFGRQTYEATSPAVTPDTMYDLASLTKAVATTTLRGHAGRGRSPRARVAPVSR